MVLMASMTTFAGVKKFGKYNRKAFEEKMLERVEDYIEWMDWTLYDDESIPEGDVAFIGTHKSGSFCIIQFKKDSIYVYDTLVGYEKNVLYKNEWDIDCSKEMYEDLYEGETSIRRIKQNDMNKGLRSLC